jgi:hypothetical protein
LIVGSFTGCGGQESTNSGSTAATSASPEAVAAVSEPTQVPVAAETPQQAVNTFLNALQTGDEKAAAAMLTTKARQETEAHDMVVEPPGAPNATYAIGRVEHPNENADAAYVSCVWSEKYQDGTEESYEVVWVLRREAPGWRVAGMATRLDDSDEPVFLDFEDLEAMEDTVQQVESQQSPATQQAQVPPADSAPLR